MMRSLLADIAILAAIIAFVAAIMLLPPKTKRAVDRNWGRVVFADPVTFAEAAKLADALVEANVFVGKPLTHRLVREPKNLRWEIAFDRDYARLFAEQQQRYGGDPKASLVSGIQAMCQNIFPGEQIEVVLIDENLEPFEQLITIQDD